MYGFSLDGRRDEITEVKDRRVFTQSCKVSSYDEWQFVGAVERGEIIADVDTLLMLHRRGHFTDRDMVEMLAKHFGFGDSFSDGVDLCPNCGADATLLNECRQCAYRCEYGNPER